MEFLFIWFGCILIGGLTKWTFFGALCITFGVWYAKN